MIRRKARSKRNFFGRFTSESVSSLIGCSFKFAVISWDEDAKSLLTSASAQIRGHTRLSEWLGKIEALWRGNGSDKRTFAEQLDFFEQLSSQFPIAKLRVIYGKAGTNPAAVMLRDRKVVIDHMLYWAEVDTIEEGRYLTAILNSETTRKKVEHWQAQGQWGARHFDKVMFNLPIQKFDAKKELHQHLSLGRRARRENRGRNKI